MPGKVLISYTWTYCMVGNLHGYKLVNRPKSGFQKFFRGFNLRNQWCWKTIFVCQLYHVILAQWLKLGDLNSSWGEQYSDITELSTWLLVFLAKHLRTSLFICLFASCIALIPTWFEQYDQRHACWNATCLPLYICTGGRSQSSCLCTHANTDVLAYADWYFMNINLLDPSSTQTVCITCSMWLISWFTSWTHMVLLHLQILFVPVPQARGYQHDTRYKSV